MYAVTLENANGEAWTVVPPCYGFMKRDVATRSRYNFYPAFGAIGNTVQLEPNKAVPFNQLKYIWNSGTHQNHAGVRENPEWDPNEMPSRTNSRYLPNPIGENDLRWQQQSNGVKDFIRSCMQEMNIEMPNPEWDYIDELNVIEAWVDAESDSIVRRHPMAHNLFGVQVDNSCPADRALFYLMFARLFTTQAGRTKTYLQARYVKNYTPMQALLVACVLSTDVDWNGRPTYSWIGSSNDSCIIPHYMLAMGMGTVYNEPTQILWRQTCYSEMGVGNVPVGHLREDGMPRLRVKEARTGQVREQLGSMLMAVASHRSTAMWWKHITIELAERHLSSYLAQYRSNTNNQDIVNSSYSQPGAVCVSYHGDLMNRIGIAAREANQDALDYIGALINTPFTQPAAAE